MIQAHGKVLVTRVRPEAAAALLADHPEAVYHERARIFTFGQGEPLPGHVAVLAAGTSDLGVAEEAAVCASWFGHEIERCYDVGVAGLHRLARQPPRHPLAPTSWSSSPGWTAPCPPWSPAWSPLRSSPCPPASATAPASAVSPPCSPCSTPAPPESAVVNIDNGYGAAVLASRIARSASMASP